MTIDQGINQPRAKSLKSLSSLENKFELGYDSDCEHGPWCNMEEEEGPQMFNEEVATKNRVTILPSEVNGEC